jgi:hypothetical protein
MIFENIEFDGLHQDLYREFMRDVEELHQKVRYAVVHSREKSLAMTKLEEFHMWLNKAIKENQIKKREAQ